MGTGATIGVAAAGGMTNVHGVVQIKMRGQSRKVVGIVIHVMAVARLGGPAWPRRSWAMTR